MNNKITNVIIKMTKITIRLFILIGLSLQISMADEISAQVKSVKEVRITLNTENSSLREVFQKIEGMTDYTFNFSKDKIDLSNNVSINRNNSTLEDVLLDISKKHMLSFKQVNNSIGVFKMEKRRAQNSIDFEIYVEVDITGKITDENGMGLPGVSIIEKGTAKGTTTDIEGNYKLNVIEGKTLVYSFVGYKTVEMEVGSRSVLDVQMELDATQLEAIVVTALGITRESKSLPYSTQSVKAKDLTEVRDPNNVINSLQGKVANALITQSSGGVGSEARIVLRGNSSISGDNSALIVVDGVPNSRGVNINPDDIESMTVLNGAAAAALYGSQAGNGVIVITTKKGSTEGVSVSLNSGVTFNRPFSLPQFQNTYGQGSSGVMNPAVGESWGEEMTGQQYTNVHGDSRSYSPEASNVSDFFNTGVNTSNSLNVSGGGEKAQGFLSYTNNKVTGIVPNNQMMSHNINLRLTNQITDKLSTDAKVTYYTAGVDGMLRATEGNTAVLDAYQIPRNMSLSDVQNFETTDAFGIPTPAPFPSTLSYRYQNPYWITNYDRSHEDRSQIFGYLSAKYQLADWLSVKGRANIDKSNIIADRQINQGTSSWAQRPGGYFSKAFTNSTALWYDLIFDGSNELSESFKVDYHLGAIYNDRTNTQDQTTANGLNVANKFSTNFATNPVVNSSASHIQTQSVFGLVNFSYKNALFFDASLRNDWDSRLPSPHSFQYYSLGGSGIISQMVTLPEVISFLKVSASYAEVGNGGQFGLLSNTYSYSAGVANGYIARGGTFSIPGLKPEIVKSTEIGFETKFVNNRYSAKFTYYKSNSTNQLLQIALPQGTGYNQQYINAGNIQNSGVEILLSASPVITNDFDWNIDFNIAFNNNKVIELSDGLDVVYQGGFTDWGGRPQIAVGGSYGDLVVSKWARDDNGKYLVTNAGLPVLSGSVGEQPSLIGNFNPDGTLGMTHSFRYKNFSMRLLVDGRFGGVIISGTEANLAHSGITESTLPYREGGWVLGGVNVNGESVDTAITSQQFWQTASNKRSATGEFFAYNATNFRVRELSIGYSMPMTPDSFIKSVKFSLVARNLLWLYRGESIMDIPGMEKRKMWFDPDVSIGSQNGFQGVEYGMPSTRSLGFNINLSF